MKILVFAPHTDDEVIGVGGTIAKRTKNGDEVQVCVVTKGYRPDWPARHLKTVREEALRAGRMLGVKAMKFLDFPVVKLNTVPTKTLCDAFTSVVDSFRPDTVYLPFPGDTNKDHTIVFESGIVATRPYVKHSPGKVLIYETITSAIFPGPVGLTFVPSIFVDIKDTLQAKLKAMAQYKSQLNEWPDPRSLEGLTILARRRGMQVALEAAESFALAREVEKGPFGV